MSKPKIRFKGFEDEWSSCKLSDISEPVIDKNINNNVSEVFTNSATLGVISQRDYFNHDIAKQENLSAYTIVSSDDFVYNPRISVSAPVGPIGRNRLGRKGVMSPLYTIFRPYDINKSFLEYFFKTTYWHDFMRFNGNSGARFDRFSIAIKDFYKMSIPSPTHEEQMVIAKFFDGFNNYISILQDKLTSLKSLKICYLNRLFPIGGGDEPPIRLAGFSGEWIERKLGDFTTRVVRKNTNLESQRVLTISALHGLVDQETYFNNRIASNNIQNYYLLRRGEFAYNKSTSQNYPFGAIKRLDAYDNGVLSTLYIAFAINDPQIESDYLAAYFETDCWHDEIRKRAAEGARNHGLLNISAEDFFDIKILLPKDRDEQLAIGKYFTELSKHILLHEEELEKLKALKESCLQGMFV